MDCRSLARNIGLTWVAKLTGSSGPGRVTGWPVSPASGWAVVSGGPAAVQPQAGRAASWLVRPAPAYQVRKLVNAARNGVSAGRPTSAAAWPASATQRACWSGPNSPGTAGVQAAGATAPPQAAPRRG